MSKHTTHLPLDGDRLESPDHRASATSRPTSPPQRRVILADTSAWIEYDRSTCSPVDERVTTLNDQNGPLAVTEPVITQVVAEARTDAHADQLRPLMLRGGLLPLRRPT